MNYYRPLIFCLLLIICTPADLSAQWPDAILNDAPNQEAFWAISVRGEDGHEISAYNSGKLVIPASNQKLYTLAAFLNIFGSDYRYQTPVYTAGAVTAGTLKGDLLIKGSGDPAISGTLYEDDRYYVFETLYRQLKEEGIARVQGNLVADISLFDGQYYPKGWDWYDMSFYYGVQISPLSFNNNAVDLVVKASGKEGETPEISWFPDSTNYVRFQNRQIISAPDREYDEYYRRKLGSNEITLGSSLPKGYLEKESLSVENPPLFFLHSFKNYLMRKGIEIDGELIISEEGIATGPDFRKVAEHISVPVSEMVIHANKESDNFYTEMFLKKMAAEVTGKPASFEKGIEAVRSFLATMKVDTNLVIMNDGSGLAGGNFTATAELSRFLHSMKSHSGFSTFYNSLAVSGVDGTLAWRMKSGDLYRRFRGKTGYVGGVRTLSGYLKTSSGKEVSLSIATNHFAGKISPVDRTHEAILQYLYENY